MPIINTVTPTAILTNSNCTHQVSRNTTKILTDIDIHIIAMASTFIEIDLS